MTSKDCWDDLSDDQEDGEKLRPYGVVSGGAATTRHLLYARAEKRLSAPQLVMQYIIP